MPQLNTLAGLVTLHEALKDSIALHQSKRVESMEAFSDTASEVSKALIKLLSFSIGAGLLDSDKSIPPTCYYYGPSPRGVIKPTLGSAYFLINGASIFHQSVAWKEAVGNLVYEDALNTLEKSV